METDITIKQMRTLPTTITTRRRKILCYTMKTTFDTKRQPVKQSAASAPKSIRFHHYFLSW